MSNTTPKKRYTKPVLRKEGRLAEVTEGNVAVTS